MDVVATVYAMLLRYDNDTEASNSVVVTADGCDKFEEVTKLFNSEVLRSRGRRALFTNLSALDLLKANAYIITLCGIATPGTFALR